MNILAPLLLPADVAVTPARKLTAQVRRRLGCTKEDWTISRRGHRGPALVVDAAAAEILLRFRAPTRIVDLVLAASGAAESEPEAFLEELYPLVRRVLAAGLLVHPEQSEASPIVPTLAIGDRFAGFEILANLQTLNDIEVYQGSGPKGLAALKIERPTAASEARQADALPWEAVVLRRLAGAVAPRLLASGKRLGRRFLALSWWPGVDAAARAAELREADDRQGILELLRAVTAAYRLLDERGVVHGDVHPSNVLVDRAGAVRLIDFALAEVRGRARSVPLGRAGVPFFYEPELAAALLAGTTPPTASPGSDQYALGALLYYLASGVYYLDFSLRREVGLRQIVEDAPLRFTQQRVAAWGSLETVLRRALAKRAEERYPDITELAAALEQVSVPQRRPRLQVKDAGRALLASTLELLDPEAPLFASSLPRPTASVNFGMAGIAYGLYRIALAREEPRILAMADLWSRRALAVGDRDEGFYDDSELTPAVLGKVSPYHCPSGPLAVWAFVVHAAGDEPGERAATTAFLASSAGSSPHPDLTTGTAGVLLTVASLLELDPGRSGPTATALLDRGRELLAGLWQRLDREPPVELARKLANLGMAHGWAGYLYATLRFCRAAGEALPGTFGERLAQLASCSHAWGRGARWRWHGTAHEAWDFPAMPGWCNGSAGFVQLFDLAAAIGIDGCRELAEGAAWHAWETPAGGADLCCGLAGRAYALLAHHRATGEASWQARARLLAARAFQEPATERAHSLYRGTLGVAVLAAELETPEEASMPFFGEEGWSPRQD